MKFGFREPSLKKRIAIRASAKRQVRHNLGLKAPFGYGWNINLGKAAYKRVYNRTNKSCLGLIMIIGFSFVAILSTATLVACTDLPATAPQPGSVAIPRPASATPTDTKVVPPLRVSTVPAPPAYARAEIVVTSLNMRSGPGTGYPIVGRASVGDIFDIVGVDPVSGWLQVRDKQGKASWISGSSKYTRINGTLNTVPTVQVSSLPPAATPVLDATLGPSNTVVIPAPAPTRIPVPPPKIPVRAATATAVPAAVGACPLGCAKLQPGCLIKGNISFSTGEKIYHVPGGAFYEATVIDPNYGERWFCTEQDAVANGWRRSKR